MNRRKATPRQLAAITLFVGSCVGLFLFLWTTFGGRVPFQSKGYEVTASFKEGAQLASQADVRISGITVGKVRVVESDPVTGRSNAVLQIFNRFAPIPKDTRTSLRTKTLLGETYVELTPGSKQSGMIPEGGALDSARVAQTVELDEMLRTFTPRTRVALQEWIQSSAVAFAGRGADISMAIGALGPLVSDTGTLMRVLDQQSDDVTKLIQATGKVTGAASARSGDLAALVSNGSRVFSATAKQQQAIRETLKALPTFEREADSTIKRVQAFADSSQSLVSQLRPIAREFSPTLQQVEALAPDLKALLQQSNVALDASEKGLPALSDVVDNLEPLLASSDELLRQANPILGFISDYKAELNAFSANAASAINYQHIAEDGKVANYLRTATPFTLESLNGWTRRSPMTRPVLYTHPGAFNTEPWKMPLFERRQCDGSSMAPVDGAAQQLLYNLGSSLQNFQMTPCGPQQEPFKSPVDGSITDYPQVKADKPTPVNK